MTAGAYPRKRVEDVLIKGKLPASYRIIPRRHLDTPLGVEPADSRFCTKYRPGVAGCDLRCRHV